MTIQESACHFQLSTPIEPADFLKKIVEIYLTSTVKTASDLELVSKAIAKLLTIVTEDVAACVAQALVLQGKLDQSMMSAFLMRHDLSSRIVLSEAATLPRSVILGATASVLRDEAASIAARPDLDLLPLQFLLSRDDRSIDILLAENRKISMPYLIVEQLIFRAVRNPGLARTLLGRPDLTLAQRGCLIMAADLETALEILGSVDTFVNLAEQEMPSLHALDPELLLSIPTYEGVRDELSARCASAFKVRNLQIERIVNDPRGVGLTILLAAHGLNSDKLIRLIEYIFSFENINFRIPPFLRSIIGSVHPKSARWLVEQMLEVETGSRSGSSSSKNITVSKMNIGKPTDGYKYSRQLRSA
ncbi:MAG: hypothetical protein ACKOC1_11475 [Hyphomicrobiales bacterium]